MTREREEENEKEKDIDKEEKNNARYGISRYFVLIMLLSFLGWTFETVYTFTLYGHYCDCGFMTLPFCPIYGCSLFAMYLLVGTPDEGRFLLKNVQNRVLRYLLYLLVAFLVPSIAELFVGAFFDAALHVRLWSYASVPYNINGYVCLPISVAWSFLIFFFMKYLFPLIKKMIGKLPLTAAKILAIALFAAVITDTTINLIKL